jgi:hypothetical protein
MSGISLPRRIVSFGRHGGAATRIYQIQPHLLPAPGERAVNFDRCQLPLGVAE